MERPYVEWLRVRGFRCIHDVDVHLTRLHAFIGPNDSGKTTLLQAIHQPGTYVTLWTVPDHLAYSGGTLARGPYPSAAGLSSINAEQKRDLKQRIQSRLLRLDPDHLRMASSLIPKNAPMWFGSERGAGLASVYDALLNRDRNAFIAIDGRFRALFPTVKALRLENTDQTHKSMGLTLHDGTDVGPEVMSEGMLYWLAFAIIEYISAAGILLVEEPENGLHPARIREVMRILREVSSRTQVLVATHSPLVINELTADEVTIVTRTQESGTICTPMKATKNFTERSKVYALGELWLAYADGEIEKELTGRADDAAKAG